MGRQSTVGGPNWTPSGQNGPKWTILVLFGEVILTKMVVWTILVQYSFRQYRGHSLKLVRAPHVNRGGATADFGDPQIRNVPVTPTLSIFAKVLPHKWGAYCRTNGRRTRSTPPICIAVLSWLLSFEERETLQYASHLYCRTNWRCTAVLFRQVVGVGVSETLPINPCHFATAHLTACILSFDLPASSRP